MKRPVLVALAGALFALGACSHSSSDALQHAHDLDAQADALLAQGKIAAAHDLYVQALAAYSSDSHAGSGAALTALLGLPDSKPITDLLDQCGQPHFDVEHQVFGASGVLAQAALARAGTAPVTIQLQSTTGASFQTVPFSADHVRATYSAATGTSGTSIYIDATNRTGSTQYVDVSFDVDDLYPGDSVATPLTDGATIDLAQHPGFGLYAYAGGGYFSNATAGTLVFHGSPAANSAMRLEFHGVTFTGGCVGGATCDATLQLDGEIDSTLVPPVQVPDDLKPFGTIVSLSTPTIRPQLVGALEACGATLSTDELVQKLAALGPLLDEIRGQLDGVLAGPAQDATFTLPKTLLDTNGDLPLNRTDLQAVRSLVHATRALVVLGIRYRYLSMPFSQFIGDQQEWTYDSLGNLVQMPAHDFLRQPLASDLDATFLSVDSGKDLALMKTELDAALADLDAVLTSPAGTSGALDLHNAHSTPFAAQLDDDVKALRASLGGQQPAPRNPGYAVNLQAFFSAPPDRQVILSRAGLSGLFTYVAGNPSGTSASELNDRIDMALPQSPADLQTWSGGTVVVPVDGRSTTCLGDTDCPAGNYCAGTGNCYPNGFNLIDPSVASDVSNAGSTALLTPAAADLDDLLSVH
jgi:hypothetical protein